MSASAVKIEGLWKEYAIGASAPQRSFREMLTSSFSAPLRRLRGTQEAYSPIAEERFWALRDLNFQIQPGEVVGVIGRNGAGKSTLLKILSRITQPTRGKVEIRGRVSSLLEVGTGFHPELTGRENLFLNGSILGMKRHEIQAKFDEIVAFAEVERFIDTPIKHYSSGMQVRLAFAVAAHLDPEILIIDEVLAVGDAAFQKKSLGRMNDFANQGRTVIFVSHHLPLVRGLCQRCLVLERGAQVHAGDTATAINYYLKSTQGERPSQRDTRQLQRPKEVVKGSGACITKVRLDNGHTSATVVSGQDLIVEFELHVTRPLSDIVLGWALSQNGLCLFETGSVDSYPPIVDLLPGQYRFRGLVANVLLAPGEYLISVGLRNARATLDYLPEVISLEVESGQSMSSNWFEERRGLFTVQGQWDKAEPC